MAKKSPVRDFLKNRSFTCILIILAVILLIFGPISVLKSRSYGYLIYHAASSISDIRLTSGDNPVVEAAGVEVRDGQPALILKPIKPGFDAIEVSYRTEEGSVTEGAGVYVSKIGMVFVGRDIKDYEGFGTTYLGLTLFFGIMTAYFIWLRREVQKDSYYSIRSITLCASIILFLVLFAVYVGADIASLLVSHVRTTKIIVILTRNMMLAYTLLTTPFMAVFAIALAVSNIELMRREGKKLKNTLGIILAVILGIGSVLNMVLFVLRELHSAGNVVIPIVYAVYSAGFTIFQALLAGSMVSCLRASNRKVAFDKDYILILGCSIRKDGTLYPLIRGRVDRAIEFWNEQFKATGKRAVFVPTGGQGSDEVISEAKAMERYLLEQGIPAEYIMAEDKAATTHENMKFSKALIDERTENAKIAYSTTNYHVFRSGLLAEEVGVKADGIGAKTKWYFWPNAMLREVAGVFSRQSKLQWLVIAGLILLAGLIGYAYTFIY